MKKIIITSADNMSSETYGYICDEFKKIYGEDTVFERIIDNAVIGGFIANINGEIFDLSIASQLKEMEKHIAK
ncbi:MAG: F0F1 ATP synthase subunit delta [Clostridia bacterium]|nr:F0F1 ATP synthase subunit delta [Clostridia bacterium]